MTTFPITHPLRDIIPLSHKVTVYVPGTVSGNIEADTTEWVDKTATVLSNAFGGATAIETVGFWNSPEHGLIREKSTMVFAYAQEGCLATGLMEVYQHCIDMKNVLAQEAVSLEVNGLMYFV